MKRIVLIGNKSWEVEPILNALLNVRIRPQELPNPTLLNYPWTFPQGTAKPRAVWDSYQQITIELWCVQDIMDPKWNPSSSQGKHECLPKILQYRAEKPDLVVALGTAALGLNGGNNNGCVVFGSNIFIHNYHPNGENAQSQWDDPAHFEKVLPSAQIYYKKLITIQSFIWTKKSDNARTKYRKPDKGYRATSNFN